MSEFDERYEALRRRFVARCATELPILEQAAQGLEPVHPETLRLTVHRMAGAAGTFGYEGLGRLAGEVDDLMMEQARPPTAALARLAEAVRALVDNGG